MYIKREKLKIIREEMEKGQQEYMAVRTAGITQKTMGVWAKQNPRLVIWRRALKERCDGKRVNMVVDSLFKVAMTGNVGAIAFFLKNKAGWKDEAFSNTVQVVNIQVKELSAENIRTEHRPAFQPI